MKSMLVAATLMAACLSVRAGTVNAASSSVTDIQSAINAAISGDTVVVPPGAATWSSGLTIPNSKGITLSSTGLVVTRGATTSTLVSISTNALISTRVTGFTFNQTTTSNIITVGGGFSNAKFRIDHCNFSSTVGLSILIVVSDAWGLIDHCTLQGDDASEIIHNEAWGPVSTAGWSDIIIPGSIDALYIEDCTFNKTDRTSQYFWGTSAIQSYYGARTVLRYCTINYCTVDQHGTPGNIGARWWEVYNNHFTNPDQGNIDKFIGIRGGSGVIFNNTKGPEVNWGSGGIELYEEDSGYPALYQIGRGRNQVLDPAYCWNNWRLATSSSSNVVDGRDFYSNTVKPGYTPLVYPHPLSVSTQLPPSNAKVQISAP